MNKADLESPGYEYLRSYENMIKLHKKLIVLNYEKEFCSTYKCPPIHRFYFSLPANNPSEQRFIFTCLCSWLIKDKCNMNLQIEPEEYEDLEAILGVVVEALHLITDDDYSHDQSRRSKQMNYPTQNKLKRGYGPEVVWTLNILADRALELLLDYEADPVSSRVVFKITYRQSPTQEKKSQSSIIIGQPFVGGGLTTRPLGNYIIDDKSLLLNDGNDDETPLSQVDPSSDKLMSVVSEVEAVDWYKRVESSKHILESVRFEDDNGSAKFDDWTEEIAQIDEIQNFVEYFLDKSRLTLESTASQIDRQLQLIEVREKYLQTQLRQKFDHFLVVLRRHSDETKCNKELVAQVDSQTDKFENLDNRLQDIQVRIEARKRALNDASKLDELKVMINRLKEENKQYDMRIGLLLAAHFKLDS